MKKSLLALAVAAALPALGYAQTNIILNGSVDGSLEYLDSDANAVIRNDPGAGSDVRVSNGVWSGSRFAISGTEELGGGLKGIFNFEHRFNVDNGLQTETRFWHGQAWVGLQGGFGAIRFGRQYTPMFRALAGGDVTGYSWYNNLAGSVAGSNFGSVGGWTLRFDNDISYQSPTIAGFTLHAAYAAGEAAGTPGAPTDTSLNDTWGLGAVGNFGPINVGVGYHNISAGDTGGGLTDDGNEFGVSLGAKFGNFGVGLAGVQTENFVGAKRKAYYASGSAGLGAGTLYLVYFQDDRGLDNQDLKGAALTYSHGLSKRTFVYGTVGYNKVDGAENLKPLRAALGVRHFF
jgi:predicted porin